MQRFWQIFDKISTVSAISPPIRKALCKAWLALFYERLHRQLMPFVLLACLFVSCCWLNIFALLPVVAHGALLLLFSLLFCAAAAFLSLLRVPTVAEAHRRLARDNHLFFDETELYRQKLPASALPQTQILWQEHKKRLAERIQSLRAASPYSDIARYDPHGLRAAVFLLFAVAFGFQSGRAGGRLSDAFYFGAWQLPTAMRADAWISPPRYTGRAPLYLLADNQNLMPADKTAEATGAAQQNSGKSMPPAVPISVPFGSRLTVRVSDNGRGVARMACSELPQSGASRGGEKINVQESEEGTASVYNVQLRQSTVCTLSTPALQKQWAIMAEPDTAPQIRWLQPPERALNGLLKLRYEIYDDYGVSKAWAESAVIADAAQNAVLYPYFAKITAKPTLYDNESKAAKVFALQGRYLSDNEKILPQAAPLQPPPSIGLNLPRPLQNNAVHLRGGAMETASDMRRSPWAGADVTMNLVAEDAAGQRAHSAPQRLVLPQQVFANPLARALSEQRQILTQNGEAALPRLADMLQAWLLWPEQTIADKGAVLALNSLRARLRLLPPISAAEKSTSEQNTAEKGAAEAAQMQQAEARRLALSDIAAYMLAIAEGIDGGKLAAAERRLKLAQQALRDALRSGATENEIAKLMQDLRDAVQEYIAMLAERGQMSDDNEQNRQMLGENELEKRLKALEDAARNGKRGLGEELLSEFENLLKDLHVRQGKGAGMAGGKSSKQGEMQKQMDALSDIMRRQQQLLDDTHKLHEGDLQNMNKRAEEQKGQSNGNNNRQKQTPEQKESGQSALQNEQMESLQERQSNLQKDLLVLQEALKARGLLPNDGGTSGQSKEEKQGQPPEQHTDKQSGAQKSEEAEGRQGSLQEAWQQMGDAAHALQRGETAQGLENQAQALQNLREGAQGVMEQMRAALQKAELERQAAGGQNGGDATGADTNGGSRGKDPLGRALGTGQTAGDWVPQQDMVQRARRILEEIRKKLGTLTPQQEKDYLQRLLDYE